MLFTTLHYNSVYANLNVISGKKLWSLRLRQIFFFFLGIHFEIKTSGFFLFPTNTSMFFPNGRKCRNAVTTLTWQSPWSEGTWQTDSFHWNVKQLRGPFPLNLVTSVLYHDSKTHTHKSRRFPVQPAQSLIRCCRIPAWNTAVNSALFPHTLHKSRST